MFSAWIFEKNNVEFIDFMENFKRGLENVAFDTTMSLTEMLVGPTLVLELELTNNWAFIVLLILEWEILA